MDQHTSYDDDIYAWSREQADVLRRLAASRRDLPNDLDVANIAEEIEDVGSSELYRVESFLELLLIHLLKVASAPNALAIQHWSAEIGLQSRSVAKHYRRSMRQKIDIDDVWQRAVARAAAALSQHGDALLANLPTSCPFGIDEITHRDFDATINLKWAVIRTLAAPSAP